MPYTTGHKLVATPTLAKTEAGCIAAEHGFFAALEHSGGALFWIDLEHDLFRAFADGFPLGMSTSELCSFTKFIEGMVVTTIHPEDREMYFKFFDLANLREHGAQGRKFTFKYRRITPNGVYKWVEAQVMPVQSTGKDEVFVLCVDVTARVEREFAIKLREKRYLALFEQACDFMIEVNLRTGQYHLTHFSKHRFNWVHEGSYTDFHIQVCRYVLPEDRERVRGLRNLEKLKETFYAQQDELVCQYGVLCNDEFVWLESQVYYIDGGEPIVYLLARDVTARRQNEEARNRALSQLNTVLRDTYSEVYELELTRDTSKCIFANSEELASVNAHEEISNHEIINTSIHPKDRARVLEIINPQYLRNSFEQGRVEVTVEFRRLDTLGAYRWVSGVAIPVRKGDALTDKAIMFIKDITEQKEREGQKRILEQYTTALSNIYDLVCECNITRDTFNIVHHSKDSVYISQKSGCLSSYIEKCARETLHPDDIEKFIDFFDAQGVWNAHSAGTRYSTAEFRFLCVDKSYRWLAYTQFPLEYDENEDKTFLVIAADIHDRKVAEEIRSKNELLEQQRSADTRYRIVVQQTSTLIFEERYDTNCHFIAPEIPQLFSGTYNDRDILRVWEEDGVIYPDDLPSFQAFAADQQLTGEHREVTLRLRQRSGVYLWCRISLTCLFDQQGKLFHRIGTLNDVDETMRATLALHEKAERDPLTGVYNVHTFYYFAAQMMLDFPDEHYSIIQLDVDGFKVLNDLYGMEEGDKLLQVIAAYLQRHMTGHSLCGRVSADVFCACVNFDVNHILNFVRDLSDMLARYPLPSKILPSVGICRVDNVRTPINVLCDWASMAQKTVKGSAVVFHAFYDDTLRANILREKKLESEMSEALFRGQFQLYLQPKVHIPTGRLIGAEGLARWLHPDEGAISPEEFIPLFEKNGFIIRLDEYIWEQTCIVLRRWLETKRALTPISVNISRMHMHDTRLYEKLVNLVDRYGIPPKLLELELTENIFFDSNLESFKTIDRLRERGFRFSLDDFGAGYSSLNILKSLPVEILKIDRGFLDETVATRRGKTIISSVITLAQSIDMEVIAEGVETAAQAAFLCATGCTAAQGFLYSQPIPVPDFEALPDILPKSPPARITRKVIPVL